MRRRAELGVPVGVEVVVSQPPVLGELLVVAQVLPVRDREPRVDVREDAGAPAGDGAEDAPPHQRLHRPGEVVVQGGDRHVRAGVGVVDREDVVAADERLAGVELPAEEGVDGAADRHHLVPGLGGEEVVVDLVAVVHRAAGVEVHDHGLGADGERPGEDVVVVRRRPAGA